MVAMDGMGQVEQRLVVSFAEVKNKTKKKRVFRGSNPRHSVTPNSCVRVREVGMPFTVFLFYKMLLDVIPVLT